MLEVSARQLARGAHDTHIELHTTHHIADCRVGTAVNDKPYPVRQDDKPRPTTKQPAAERDRGLAGLAQLEASPAVPAGRIAQMLDYALSNSGSPLIIKRCVVADDYTTHSCTDSNSGMTACWR
jgi:hypothetical protein